MSAVLEGKQYLIFRIDRRLFAVSIKDVERIVSIDLVYKVPLTRRHFEGLVKLDERALPVFDLAGALGLDAGSFDERVVAIERIGGQDVGLLVCDVVTVARIAPADILDCESEYRGVNQKVMWNGSEVNILSAEELVLADDSQ